MPLSWCKSRILISLCLKVIQPMALGQCNTRSIAPQPQGINSVFGWYYNYYTAWWHCVNNLPKDVMEWSEVGVEPTTFWLYCHAIDCTAVDFLCFMLSPIRQWQGWIWLVHHFKWQKFNITTNLIYIMNCNSVFVWEIVITDGNTVKVVLAPANKLSFV